MIGIKYNSLDDLNGQALAWCNKVNGKVHATTGEIPFERLKKEGLNPLSREYIIDKINLRPTGRTKRLPRVVASCASLVCAWRRKARLLRCSSFPHKIVGFCGGPFFAGNQYSVPSEYVGKDVAVIGLDNMLAIYHGGKQIALHRISYQKKDMVRGAHHYRRLTVKQSFDIENTLLDGDNIIDFPIKAHDLSRYDEAALYE